MSSFGEFKKRVDFLSKLNGEERVLAYKHINSKGFWDIVEKHIQ